MLRFGRFIAVLRIINSRCLSKNRVSGVFVRGSVRGVCDLGTESEHFVVEIEYLCVTFEDLIAICAGLDYGPNR